MSGAGKRPEIERGPLRDLLLDSLQPDTVQWDHKLQSAAFAGEQVLLQFAGKPAVPADIVIGSDGANSRLRGLLTSIRPTYVGVSLVEGVVPAAKQTIPALSDLLGGAALIALGGERTIGMGTKPDASVLFYAGLKTDGVVVRQTLESAISADQRVAWFRANFQGWNPLWEPLFGEAASLVWRPLLVCPERSALGVETQCDADRRRRARDAARTRVKAVNMAMLDVLVLSKLLLDEKTPAVAIAAYEAEMFARMRHMMTDTMMNTEMFYAPDAAERVVGLFRKFGAAEAGS